jgi:PAS domain S-box-containing protein
MRAQSRSILQLGLGVSPWSSALFGIVIIKAVLSLAVTPGSFVASYSGISYFLLLALGTCFAIRNGIQDRLGGRLFWASIAIAYALWAADQGLWLYYELGLRIEVPDNSIADSLLFLHVGVLVAAVATLPHRNESARKPYAAGLNALLVLLFWIFVYGYVVFPYQYLFSSATSFSYALRFDLVYLLENLALVLAVGVLALRVKAPWKSTYLHLLAAATLYALSSTVANLAIDSGGYVNGKLYGLGLTASVCWFVWLPLGVRRRAPRLETKAAGFNDRQDSQVSVWAMLVVVMISFPIFWELFQRNENSGLRTLRVVFATAMIVCLAGAAYVKEYLANRELASGIGVANDRLRLAMESGKSVGWDWDVKTGRDTWFGDLETVFGIPGDMYTGCVEDFRRRVHPQDRSRVWNAVNEAMKNRAPYSAEFRVVRADESIRWIAAKGEFYFQQTGEPKRMLGIAIDITELKQAQHALQESEERLRMAIHAGKMYAYEWHAGSDAIIRSGDIPSVLVSAGDTSLTRQQLLASVHPEDRGQFAASVSERTPESPDTQISYRLMCPDGSTVWLEKTAHAFFDEEGRVGRMIGMVADITQRKRAEETLRQSEERFRSVFRDAGVGMLVVSPEGRFLAANKAFCECLGYSEEELLEKTVQAVTFPGDWPIFSRILTEALNEGRGYQRFEKRCLHKSGRIVYTESTASLIRDREGTPQYFVGEVVDVTKRKEAEEALSDMTRKLIEAQEQERARIARELHDNITQHLAMLAMELSQLRKKTEDLPPEVRDRMYELQQMTSDISSGVHALSHELHSSTLEYLGLVTGMRSWCKEFGQRQQLEIDFKSQDVPKLPRDVSLCLFRVLQEALHNAAKHSGANRVEVLLAENGREVHLIVRDPGRGFDMESAMRSQGLGLTSMQERVRLVGGAIVIDSKPLAGTTIQVTVPCGTERGYRRQISRDQLGLQET